MHDSKILPSPSQWWRFLSLPRLKISTSTPSLSLTQTFPTHESSFCTYLAALLAPVLSCRLQPSVLLTISGVTPPPRRKRRAASAEAASPLKKNSARRNSKCRSVAAACQSWSPSCRSGDDMQAHSDAPDERLTVRLQWAAPQPIRHCAAILQRWRTAPSRSS